MYLFYAIDIPENIAVGQSFVLDEEESAHAVRVLRYTAGKTIHIADGRGTIYEACITNPHPKHCEVEILGMEPQAKHHPGNVHIAVAPTKNIERMEWLAEKCTEIGVDTLTPLLCHYSERKVIRTDRLQKIVLSAAKQSLSAYLPRLNELTAVKDCILGSDEQRRYIAHSSPWTNKRDLRDELRSAPAGIPTIVLIGPEGGFSDDEVRLAMEHGFIPVSLGEARLRTETAAIVACTMINVLTDCSSN
ncbi:MAG: 16S rRNA (uracil(1498)-N(3))-methyltransferase [Paludibacteraceae bacterium]|nr:16S rRNA (uracil(1498)-N(3))-methyltransferase [Paludibacteraceae bacterium]